MTVAGSILILNSSPIRSLKIWHCRSIHRACWTLSSSLFEKLCSRHFYSLNSTHIIYYSLTSLLFCSYEWLIDNRSTRIKLFARVLYYWLAFYLKTDNYMHFILDVLKCEQFACPNNSRCVQSESDFSLSCVCKYGFGSDIDGVCQRM